jgi:hypothetical protein
MHGVMQAPQQCTLLAGVLQLSAVVDAVESVVM